MAGFDGPVNTILTNSLFSIDQEIQHIIKRAVSINFELVAITNKLVGPRPSKNGEDIHSLKPRENNLIQEFKAKLNHLNDVLMLIENDVLAVRDAIGVLDYAHENGEAQAKHNETHCNPNWPTPLNDRGAGGSLTRGPGNPITRY